MGSIIADQDANNLFHNLFQALKGRAKLSWPKAAAWKSCNILIALLNLLPSVLAAY